MNFKKKSEKDQLRFKKKTLKTVLEHCQSALELLNDTTVDDGDDGGFALDVEEDGETSRSDSPSSSGDREADELCDLLKSRLQCRDFLEKLECAKVSVPQNVTVEGSSWDLVGENDLWGDENGEFDQEDYVVVQEEDILDGIACFMAAYLLSLKQTKDLTPNQLQEALSKTFSAKKKKGKLQKAWDGSKVVYNLASWGATAIGIYQNPVILSAASNAFWTSCNVISKLL